MKLMSMVAVGMVGLGIANFALADTPPTTMVIHNNKAGVRVSPTLYGIFFEEINHSGEGGLYAELVRNRTFKETGANGPAGWTLKTSDPDARLILDDSAPLNPANPNAARIDSVDDAATHKPGFTLTNDGYWGINLKKDAKYTFSFYARATNGFTGHLQAQLVGHGGTVHGSFSSEDLTGDWKKYTGTLTADADDAAGKLVLSSGSVGTVWLNVVSLFPEDTYKHRANGLRKDLAEMVEAMHPAFMRFPGGCYVEGGDYVANAFRWKNTIGDVAERPGHANATWRYWSTDGLGYHEYLQLCEDIHAAPMFVCNVGISHRETVPLEMMPDFVQNVLDAIEYANGPVDSTWGALRAKNGHPESFHLKYLEIGNENGMWTGWGGTHAAYNERYNIVYEAVKAKYPEIQCISNTRVESPADLVDDHVYERPSWFWGNIHQYDNTPRGVKPDVYVGEYADTIDCGTGNLRAALAEAAYMTGFERNSEVVRMSSYARMFVQTNDRRWNPDAMVFDSARAFGTPSYWVQKLYADNRPDEVVPMDLQSPAPQPDLNSKGTIGLGTWNTQAEYKDINVTVGGKNVYSSDNAAEWKPFAGEWKTTDGVIAQTATGTDLRNVLNLPALADATDYTITLKARKTGGDEGFLVMFHARDEQNYYWWNLGGWGNTDTVVEKSLNGAKSEIGQRGRLHIANNQWYDLKIDIQGSRIRCYLNDKLVDDVNDAPPMRFTAIAGKADSDHTIIIKAINGSNDDVSSSLKFDSEMDATGQAITMSSGNDADENTFEDPMKISPKTSDVKDVAKSFSYTFPARSVTILRLKQK